MFEAQPGHAPNESQYGWDGTKDGRYVEQGVYVYAIKVSYTDGDSDYFTGDITFLRD